MKALCVNIVCMCTYACSMPGGHVECHVTCVHAVVESDFLSVDLALILSSLPSDEIQLPGISRRLPTQTQIRLSSRR